MYYGPKVVGNFKKKEPKRDTRVDRKDPKHLEFIRSLPSIISFQTERIVAHHLLSIPNTRGVGIKAPDKYTVPLTWDEHNRLHNECAAKTEQQWFTSEGIVGLNSLAERLWRLSGDWNAAVIIIKHHHCK